MSKREDDEKSELRRMVLLMSIELSKALSSSAVLNTAVLKLQDQDISSALSQLQSTKRPRLAISRRLGGGTVLLKENPVEQRSDERMAAHFVKLAQHGFIFSNNEKNYGTWPRGSFGRIGKCTHKKGGKKVFAVKMPVGYGNGWDAIVEHELMQLKKVFGLPGIVQLAIIENIPTPLRLSDRTSVLVFDYVQHIQLEHIKGELAEKWAVSGMFRCLLQLSMAMICLHEKGLVHCDLKPSNVLIHASLQTVTLSDLGKCRAANNGFCHNSTQGWRAPEHTKTKAILFRDDSARASDIWAIGVVALNFTAGLSDLVNKGDPPKYDYAAQDSMLAELSQGGREGWCEEVVRKRRLQEKEADDMFDTLVLGAAKRVWNWAYLNELQFDQEKRFGALESLTVHSAFC